MVHINPFPTNFLKLYTMVLLNFCRQLSKYLPSIFCFACCIPACSWPTDQLLPIFFASCQTHLINKWIRYLGFTLCNFFFLFTSTSPKSFNNLFLSFSKSYLVPTPYLSVICFIDVPHWSLHSNSTLYTLDIDRCVCIFSSLLTTGSIFTLLWFLNAITPKVTK